MGAHCGSSGCFTRGTHRMGTTPRQRVVLTLLMATLGALAVFMLSTDSDAASAVVREQVEESMVSTEVTSGVTSETDEADSAIAEYAHVKDRTQAATKEQVLRRNGRVARLESQVHGLKFKLRKAAHRTRQLIRKVKAAARRSLKTAKKVLRKAHKKA